MSIGNVTDVIDQFKTVEELDQLRDYVLYKKQLIDRNKTHDQIIAERQRALTEAIQNRNRDRMPLDLEKFTEEQKKLKSGDYSLSSNHEPAGSLFQKKIDVLLYCFRLFLFYS